MLCGRRFDVRRRQRVAFDELAPRLDVVAHRGADTYLPPGQPVTPAELDDVARAQGVTIEPGDIVVVHTGWWTHFTETGDGAAPGSGLHWSAASWLHDHRVAAVAADGTALPLPPSSGGTEGQKVVYGTRPEHIEMAAGDDGVPTEVVVVEPTGADTQS